MYATSEYVMSKSADILITGTGAFASRILFDLAATVGLPTRIAVAGRNPARLDWLRTAARARAHMYGRPAEISSYEVDLNHADQCSEALASLRPVVILQAASFQPGGVISGQSDAWAALVANGGLSASAVFQALLSLRISRCCKEVLPATHFINACFPDVANSLIAAMGLPVTCGVGNIQILAHAFGGELCRGSDARLRVLAHYQNLAAWRRGASERVGPNVRAWIGEKEIEDVFATFPGVQLTREPVIDVSGAAAAPLLVALAHSRDWTGHVPGPAGLPGGYPVRLRRGALEPDLPSDLPRETAIRWNLAHEETNGLTVDAHGNAHYHGKLREALAAASPELANGFHVRDIEDVFTAMQKLRSDLQKRRL